jgi:ADP-heptose:LPS heptosyltransferase
MSAERILMIQLRQLGDTLMSTPVLRELRRLHPHAEIDWLCQGSNACILRHNPHVSHLQTLPRGASAGTFVGLAARLRRRRYDLVVDIQSLPKTAALSWFSGARERIGLRRRWRHALYTKPYVSSKFEYTAVARLRLLQDPRVRLDDVALDFYVSEQERQQAQDFCRRWFRPPVAAIYGARGDYTRRWSSDNFAAIADRLAERGFQPYLVFGPGEQAAAREIAARMRSVAVVDYEPLPLPVLKETLAACSLMVTCDGGPKHVATSAGLPTVTLYHGDLAITWNPPHCLRHRVVTTHLDVSDPPVVGTITQAASTDEIPVESVWAEVERLLQGDLSRLSPTPVLSIPCSQETLA